MPTFDTPEAVRLQCLANGYTPIRNWDKRTFMQGWPNAVITEDEIRRWTRRYSRDAGTGLRIENGLMAIDFDVDDEIAMKEIFNAVMEAVPALGDPDAPLLVRHGKGAKEAWFVRTEELFSRIFSHGWVKPGAAEDDGVYRVEIFGGAMPRQFGAFGPHTREEDGTVKIEYRWFDLSPLEVPLAELPMLIKQDCFTICDIVDATLLRLGWRQAMRSNKGEGDVSRVYDLTEEMFFDLDTGERVPLQLLRELALQRTGLRCSASWLEGPSAVNKTRCIVGHTHDGKLTIWESASGQTHLEKQFAPRDYTADLNRLNEKLKEIEETRRNRISPGDTALPTAAKLLNTYAFCPTQQLGVVPIWASDLSQGMTLSSFRTMMLPHCDEELGPRGGRVVINPVDIWASSERRKTVQGLRMRPDKERPIYEDAGEQWINTYSPPLHDAAGGSPDVGVGFLDYLLPNEQEREYFTQWLAYKFRHPWVPGPAIVMVARQQGTGRGTLGELLKRLFGSSYVTALPFSIFSGRSYQSQYTDWGATSVLALISESSEIEGSVYRAKTNTYEHLKELIEPRPHEKMFVTKGTKSFKALSCTSYIIATNNVDAISIPATDRRIAVLANGDPASELYWQELNAWMDNPANVAAFGEWLLQVDLTGYSPFVAPRTTQAKETMIDAAASDIGTGMDAAFASLRSEVYVVEQLVNRMRAFSKEMQLSYPDSWQDIARREIKKRGYRVGVRHGSNWLPQFDGNRLAVYATSERAARHWMTLGGLREEVLRNGKVVSGDSVVTDLGERLGRGRDEPSP